MPTNAENEMVNRNFQMTPYLFLVQLDIHLEPPSSYTV